MAVHDLRQKTKASTGQRIIKDESSCNCSERAKVMGKSQVVNIFKKGKESIRNAKRTQKS